MHVEKCFQQHRMLMVLDINLVFFGEIRMFWIISCDDSCVRLTLWSFKNRAPARMSSGFLSGMEHLFIRYMSHSDEWPFKFFDNLS